MNNSINDQKSTEYRVLARKYRPQNFSDLIGQDTLVKTLENALKQGRLAHAFILTGVRGVGKTTTARIIAKGLNCIGTDGLSGPTINPCGVCSNCCSITDDRHVDVIEMDAANIILFAVLLLFFRYGFGVGLRSTSVFLFLLKISSKLSPADEVVCFF